MRYFEYGPFIFALTPSKDPACLCAWVHHEDDMIEREHLKPERLSTFVEISEDETRSKDVS